MPTNDDSIEISGGTAEFAMFAMERMYDDARDTGIDPEYHPVESLDEMEHAIDEIKRQLP